MRTALVVLALVALPLGAPAQVPLRREMARLGFMVGTWQGTGWVRYAQDGPARAARVRAEGQPRLAGLVLGWTSTAVSTDLSIRFRADSAAFRATLRHGGAPVDGWVRPGACEVAWGYRNPSDAQTLFRFRSRVEGTRRVEAGERSPDGGRTWWAFYGAEMQGPVMAGCEAPRSAAPQPQPSAPAARPF